MKKTFFVLLYILFFSYAFAQSTNIIKLEGKVQVTKDNVNYSLVDLDTEFSDDDWIYTGIVSQIIFEFNNTVVKVNSFKRVKVSEIVEQIKKEERIAKEKTENKITPPEPKYFLSSTNTTKKENVIIIMIGVNYE